MIGPIRLLMVLLIALALFSCGKSSDRTTAENIEANATISPEKMSLVLADIHVVEAAFLLRRNGEADMPGIPEAYYDSIFHKHHITSLQYRQTLAYYRQNPDKYKKLYEKVVKILDERQKRFSGKP